MSESPRLCKVFLCLDPTKPVGAREAAMVQFLAHLQLPVQLVFTRVDRVRSDIFGAVSSLSQQFLPLSFVDKLILITSS